MKLTLQSVLTTTVLIVMATVANATDDISVNFSTNGGGGDDAVLAASDVAGVVPRDNWADASGTTGSLMHPEGANVTWSTNNSWGGTAVPAPTDPDAAMMTAWLDDGNATVMVDSIPFPVYDLYIYGTSDGGNAGAVMTWEVNGNPFATSGVFVDPVSANGDFYFGHVDGATGEPNPTYLKINDLSGDLTITGNRAGGSRGGISGFQIIRVPEPTSIALLFFAVAGLIRFFRRT